MDRLKYLSRQQIATAIAIIFHMVGLAGMLFFDKTDFVKTTPVHLLLMASLIVFTHSGSLKQLCIFFLVVAIGGFLVEYIGTSTGILFGNYKYGNVLGPKLWGVPIIIGFNWVIIIFCCGTATHIFFNYLYKKLEGAVNFKRKTLHQFSIIIDGAFLAVIFDYILEPVAIKLGYWSWIGDDIPLYNYVCWFVFSAIFLSLFRLLKLQAHNLFAVHLLLIQVLFFLILNTFL